MWFHEVFLSVALFPNSPLPRNPHLAMRAVVAVCVALLAVSASAYVSFDGDIVYRVSVPTASEAARLGDVIEELRLDQWSESKELGQVDVRVPSARLADFARLNFDSEVLIADLQERTVAERNRIAKRARKFTSSNLNEFFDDYHTYDEHVDFLTELSIQYPDITELTSIGTTYEGREIVALRITGGNAKKGFFFNGGQHAREWIGPATVAGLAYNLVSQYGQDANVTRYVDEIDWTIVTVLNPDGYEYTWTNDRMWRKNREPTAGATCIGTDVNRNWEYKWGTGGSSSMPCSDTYMGPSAMSAAENSAVDAYLRKQIADGLEVDAYIDFHAYSQLWMHPWGYTCDALTADDEIQQIVDDAAVGAIYDTGYNTRYTTGPVCRTIYQASGGSNDHTYSLGIKFSFAVELRDTGRYGFELPAEQIVESIEETWEGLKVVADYVLA